jgi:hypothetical protein
VLHIKNFDGMNFKGKMAMPENLSQFSGKLVGPNVSSGSASGAFVKDGRSPVSSAFVNDSNQVSRQPPPGVIGNFGVQGDGYKASGIFGGALKPPGQD